MTRCAHDRPVDPLDPLDPMAPIASAATTARCWGRTHDRHPGLRAGTADACRVPAPLDHPAQSWSVRLRGRVR